MGVAFFFGNLVPVSGNRDHEFDEPPTSHDLRFVPNSCDRSMQHLLNTRATLPDATLIFSSKTRVHATLATKC